MLRIQKTALLGLGCPSEMVSGHAIHPTVKGSGRTQISIIDNEIFSPYWCSVTFGASAFLFLNEKFGFDDINGIFKFQSFQTL